jgi:hypothetical protein
LKNDVLLGIYRKNKMEEIDFLDDSDNAVPKILVTSPAGAEVALLHESEKVYYKYSGQPTM